MPRNVALMFSPLFESEFMRESRWKDPGQSVMEIRTESVCVVLCRRSLRGVTLTAVT